MYIWIIIPGHPNPLSTCNRMPMPMYPPYACMHVLMLICPHHVSIPPHAMAITSTPCPPPSLAMIPHHVYPFALVAPTFPPLFSFSFSFLLNHMFLLGRNLCHLVLSFWNFFHMNSDKWWRAAKTTSHNDTTTATFLLYTSLVSCYPMLFQPIALVVPPYF